MTIIYQYRVANATLGTFVKLLVKWKGSVYKLVYKEMIIFLSMYAAISLTYRIALTEEQRLTFESISKYCNYYTNLIPVSFVLGFYVSLIVHRWWTQFMNVPWPDRTLFLACCYLEGSNDKGRIYRRSLARYMLFGLILILRSISVAVMKRFPTLDHLVEAGFITKEEALMYEQVDCKYNKFWVPLMWANSVLVQAKKDGHISNEWGLRMIIQALADFRDRCSLCFVYDWITVPLIYTQVVTLAVYMFFAACLIGRQFLDPSKKYSGYDLDLYFPVFTLLQFFFYMGWLKVAEQLINPFGEDDDDFDMNWLIDRHTAVAMTLVDQMYGQHPPLVKDMYYDEVVTDLPYTEASIRSKKPVFLGSTYNLAAPAFLDQRFVNPEDITDDNRHRRESYGSNFGSHFAGSMLSLFRGRSSSYARSSNQYTQDHLLNIPSDRNFPQNYYMDHLHATNGNVHVPFTPGRQRKFNSVSETLTPSRKVSFEIPKAGVRDIRRESLWSSDTHLDKLNHIAEGRQRSNTDATEEDIILSTPKKQRRRKISFPLSLFRRLTSDSKKQSLSLRSQPDQTKLVNPENNNDTQIPEYVPLKRVAPVEDDMTKKRTIGGKKRKSSFPLTHIIDQTEHHKNGSTNSIPGLAVKQEQKASRFVIEQVQDNYDTEESNSVHLRNAQKLKDAMSGKNVSRAPLLSAIEEGGTITSMTQILPSDDSDDDIMARPENIILEEEEEEEMVEQSAPMLEQDESNCISPEENSSELHIPLIKIDFC